MDHMKNANVIFDSLIYAFPLSIYLDGLKIEIYCYCHLNVSYFLVGN